MEWPQTSLSGKPDANPAVGHVYKVISPGKPEIMIRLLTGNPATLTKIKEQFEEPHMVQLGPEAENSVETKTEKAESF